MQSVFDIIRCKMAKWQRPAIQEELTFGSATSFLQFSCPVLVSRRGRISRFRDAISILNQMDEAVYMTTNYGIDPFTKKTQYTLIANLDSYGILNLFTVEFINKVILKSCCPSSLQNSLSYTEIIAGVPPV